MLAKQFHATLGDTLNRLQPNMLPKFALSLALTLCFAANQVALAATCNEALFVDQIPQSAWTVIDLTPDQGTRGLGDAFYSAQFEFPDRPVRIRLAPGLYADNMGGEVFVQHLFRDANNPVWVEAIDPRPNATVLGHGINMVGVSYIALEGLTIGPERVGAWNGFSHADPLPLQAQAGVHVAGAALNGFANAVAADGSLDMQIYGRFEPSHHIVVRRVTVQNLYGRTDRDAEVAEDAGMDGIKFNQATDVWVLDSTVSQTSRHGIDNVGVHRAAFCRNYVGQNGGGLGIEAKGGSVDVLYEGNTFYRVRRVDLGGEDTDATYYFSADGRWDYEALRTVARNNLIVDAREAALEFSGCADCTAIGNSIVFTAAYRAPTSGGDSYGGDAIRIHNSRTLGSADNAGNDCQVWDAAQDSYVTADPCWGVGARAPAPANRALVNRNVTVQNNLFAAEAGVWGKTGTLGAACPLNWIDGTPTLNMNANLWWNGGFGLLINGCAILPEGSASKLAQAGVGTSPLTGGVVDTSSLASVQASLVALALPRAGGSAWGGTIANPLQGSEDRLGAPRATGTNAALGAIASTNPASDRIFNFAERYFPSLFPGHSVSGTIQDYYYRYYPSTNTYLASQGGQLLALLNGQLVNLGALEPVLGMATGAGF